MEQPSSNFDYCEGQEASIRDQNTLLRLKAEDLRRRGYEDAAKVLSSAHERVSFLCKNYPQNHKEHRSAMMQITVALGHAKESDEVKNHRSVGDFIGDFMQVVRGAGFGDVSPSEKRSSFWYQRPTNIENKLEQSDESDEKLGSTPPDSP